MRGAVLCPFFLDRLTATFGVKEKIQIAVVLVALSFPHPSLFLSFDRSLPLPVFVFISLSILCRSFLRVVLFCLQPPVTSNAKTSTHYGQAYT